MIDTNTGDAWCAACDATNERLTPIQWMMLGTTIGDVGLQKAASLLCPRHRAEWIRELSKIGIYVLEEVSCAPTKP